MTKLTFVLLVLCGMFMQAQSKATAPENPVALQYRSIDFGLIGPVKTVDEQSFDKQGRILEETGDDPKKFTYSDNTIMVEKYGNLFTYVLNDQKQIVSYTISGSEDSGMYYYDSNGNLIEEKSTSDGYDSRNTYTYDAQNRLITATEWYGDEPYLTNYSYDGTAELLFVRKTKPDDNTADVTYTYKNGALSNYNHQGTAGRTDIKTDSHGNWTSFYSPVYDYTEKRVIAYYQ